VKRTQYQSLEGLTGGSDSSGKLSRLKLDQLGRGRARPLEGFSVLDLGCNEGFFCNAARELGAARIVGIDRSEDFIQRARLRFPEIKFLHGSWWDLPDEQFDVILFLSAIHYEPEQKKLLDLLSTRLKPEGTLVLECGAVADDHRAPSWQAIERHDGLKRYPTFAHLRRGLLSKFAVRVIGQSVPQRGDPIPRVVLHCTPRRPVALLIHGDSMSGKSTLAELLRMGNVPSYSIDRLFFRLTFDEAYSRSDLSKWLRKVGGDQKNWSIAAKAVVDHSRQQDLAARIVAELPIDEAPVFAIEGEALCHDSIHTAVNEALDARGVIVWSVGRLSHT
jgi:SAM-dependent methyltransferase